MQDAILIFWMVFLTWLFADLLKTAIDTARNKRFRLRMLLAYGGMPSSHTTFVTALAVSIFIVTGFSVEFLLSAALFILVIRDLITLRNGIDKNTLAIHHISKNKTQPALLSHGALEIIAGFLIGATVPVLLFLYFLS
jgi:uncharacterized protein